MFLIRNHPKLGQGLTLEEWCLYLACPTGKIHWDKHNLSQWDIQFRTSCVCPSGTNTGCPNWDWERSEETSPCPMGQVIFRLCANNLRAGWGIRRMWNDAARRDQATVQLSSTFYRPSQCVPHFTLNIISIFAMVLFCDPCRMVCKYAFTLQAISTL